MTFHKVKVKSIPDGSFVDYYIRSRDLASALNRSVLLIDALGQKNIVSGPTADKDDKGRWVVEICFNNDDGEED